MRNSSWNRDPVDRGQMPSAGNERLVATEGLRTLIHTIVVTKDRHRSVQDKIKRVCV